MKLVTYAEGGYGETTVGAWLLKIEMLKAYMFFTESAVSSLSLDDPVAHSQSPLSGGTIFEGGELGK